MPFLAGTVLGKYALPALALGALVAAIGEQAGWWHARWILGEGIAGRGIGLAAALLYMTPAMLVGLVARRGLQRRADRTD